MSRTDHHRRVKGREVARDRPTKAQRKTEVLRKDRHTARHATNKARHTQGDVDLPNLITRAIYGGGWWH